MISALGERVTKTSPTGTTHFHYDRAGHLIAETDSAGATIREYLWLGDMPIGLVATQTGGSGPELFAVHTDHLATTLRITDNLQQTAWKSTREPFGESTLATTNTVIWPLRFPGQYEDNETGFVYNYFRDYDPVIGRYVESDPIGLDGGINTYAYVNENPLTRIDPYGLYGTTVDKYCMRYGPAACAEVMPKGSSAAKQASTIICFLLGYCDASDVPKESKECPSEDGDYPENPDERTPPEGVTEETSTRENTNGKHRQWKNENGDIVRRWDREGRENGKECGAHWHDANQPGGLKDHIDPNR